MNVAVNLDYATATTVPYIDANKQLISSTVTPTQLEFLSTATQDVQVALDNKVDLTTAQTVAGDKTFSGSTEFSNTGATLLNRGTELQRPTGVNGMMRYNSDDERFEGFVDSSWSAIGGGGGASVIVSQEAKPKAIGNNNADNRINLILDLI